MSSSASGSPSSLPRLGPTWSKGGGGRGFQPPPPAVTRSRSGSVGSSGSESRPPNLNKFSVLDDDDDVNCEQRPANSRSEALRTFHRSSSSGPKPTGRSLADLAARAPPTGVTRSSSAPFRGEEGGGVGGGGRFSGLSSGDGEGSNVKVIRFTREKLLSMRKAPGPNDPNPPEVLKHIEGTSILSPEPQDPVCWDTFDPDEIWAQVPRDRMTRSGSIGGPKGPPSSRLDVVEDKRRVPSISSGGGRWQRGVALPPPDESANRRRVQQVDAENPNDLWDDPITGPTGAASDFSAFGAIPDEPNGGGGGDEAFDFDKMTEATNRFEMERHGSKGSDALSEGEDEPNMHSIHVNPQRPLASAGTTIQSGSGDDVNVFEDFDDETPGETDDAMKGAIEDTSASSRLMKMIGVNKEETDDATPAPVEEPEAEVPAAEPADSWGLPTNGTVEPKAAAIPSNPWGSLIGADPNLQQQSGMDLASRLEAVSAEQNARDAQIAAEMERRKAQEEGAKRRQQAAAAAKPQQPSQVELVLMERISTFLENSWGRSDLVSVLSTLHVEDSRVIPLLGNVDALRALIARHPSRIGLRQDPAFGTEMAVLLLTNAQWAKREQLARQEEQQRIELQRREEAMRQAAAQKPRAPVISADAPWFYSDPQNNVQGPFRGEEMRQWLEAGYFKGDLPISQQPNGPFVPLQRVFSDISLAFRVPGDASGDNAAAAEAAAAAAAAEEEKRAREEAERRAAEERARAEAEAAAEAKRREKEAAEKKQAAARDQNQSAQLKMMLGLGKSAGSEEKLDVVAYDQPAEAAPPKKKAEKAPKANKQQRQPSPAPTPTKAPAASPAWGGGASTAPRKSIAEIQQEEARTAARTAMERQHNPSSSSGGWANIAASKGGSIGWQSGAVKPTPAAVVTNANAAAANRTARPQATSGQRQSKTRGISSEKSADDFGASMPPALENWCKAQMQKLNGSDDLTLVSFCMTLNDGDEIRQYLTAYLGSTPQVNNFATEFIARKNGGKGKQDEWESATKVKKGKK